MISLSTVVTLIKAVPMVKAIFEKIIDIYVESEISKIQNARASQKQKINALLLSISRCKTDDERQTYSIMLADISR